MAPRCSLYEALEQAVSWLYAVANTDPDRESRASQQRQIRDATNRLLTAFQRGSAGMRLKDQETGLKAHIPPELFAELDRFIKGPRNQLEVDCVGLRE
jgi:predicted  nucleic acid-binding Zn-ribbon protein